MQECGYMVDIDGLRYKCIKSIEHLAIGDKHHLFYGVEI